MTSDTENPFVKGLKAELDAHLNVPKGYRLATGPEVGIFYEDGHPMNYRRIWLKPTNDAAGIEAWEKQAAITQASHDALPKELIEAQRKQGPMPSHYSIPMAETQADTSKVTGVRLEKPDLPTRKVTR